MSARFDPKREIAFAVRMGFITKNLWREFFGQDYGGERWQNVLWQRLVADGYFRAHESVPDLYLPNSKHREVRFATHSIAKPPNVNQLVHDELAARTYLHLSRRFDRANFQTEALLRKEAPINNRGKLITDGVKHPDLTMQLNGMYLAFEIELTQKSRARYRTALRHLRSMDFDTVIYAIRSVSTKNAIESAAHQVSFPTDKIALGFASIGQWKLDPASTPIHFANEQKTLTTMFETIPAQI